MSRKLVIKHLEISLVIDLDKEYLPSIPNAIMTFVREVTMSNENRYIVDFFGLSVDITEIINYLRKNLKLKECCQNVLYQQIIYQAAQEGGLIVTPEEIQAEINRWRLENRLETEADINRWLVEQMLTMQDWEEAIHQHLLEQRLSDSLFSREIEEFFAHHQHDFDQVLLYKLIVPYEHLALELFYQISSHEISFYEAAHLYDIDPRRREHCGYEGKLYRCNLDSELAAVIFNASIGELIGPIITEQGIHLLMVEEMIPSELTTTIRQNILKGMFKQWLENQLDNLLPTDELNL
jgi:parvulin-like peptidyl-prolyl isomerase